MTSNAPPIETSAFGIDDLIIVPLVLATWAVIKLLRLFVSILVHILDYAFPVAIQVLWVPLLAARLVGDLMLAVLNGALRTLPLGEMRRREWAEALGRNWTRLRERISYRAFEHAVHVAFEGGMGWVFRSCRQLTPRTALLVIFGAVLWLPISFGTATALHAILLAKAVAWPAWLQLLHPLATLIAKSKLLVLPVYPAAWPQARKHPLVQVFFAGYRVLADLLFVRKFGLRYCQAKSAAAAAADAIRRAAGMSPAATRLRQTAQSIEGSTVVHKPSQKLRSFFARWSIKFTAEYYEAKELGSLPLAASHREHACRAAGSR